jgi:hypothetical protein
MQTPPRHDEQRVLPAEEEILRQVVKAIRSVRFGQVQIIIQDSRVVQIDTTEKVRLA